MNQDDDVERLFSWLQTPDLRYREFAGAREVTDAVVTLRDRANTPERVSTYSQFRGPPGHKDQGSDDPKEVNFCKPM